MLLLVSSTLTVFGGIWASTGAIVTWPLTRFTKRRDMQTNVGIIINDQPERKVQKDAALLKPHLLNNGALLETPQIPQVTNSHSLLLRDAFRVEEITF